LKSTETGDISTVVEKRQPQLSAISAR